MEARPPSQMVSQTRYQSVAIQIRNQAYQWGARSNPLSRKEFLMLKERYLTGSFNRDPLCQHDWHQWRAEKELWTDLFGSSAGFPGIEPPQCWAPLDVGGMEEQQAVAAASMLAPESGSGIGDGIGGSTLRSRLGSMDLSKQKQLSIEAYMRVQAQLGENEGTFAPSENNQQGDGQHQQQHGEIGTINTPYTLQIPAAAQQQHGVTGTNDTTLPSYYSAAAQQQHPGRAAGTPNVPYPLRVPAATQPQRTEDTTWSESRKHCLEEDDEDDEDNSSPIPRKRQRKPQNSVRNGEHQGQVKSKGQDNMWNCCGMKK